MTQKRLNGPDIVAILQQVSRTGMSQSVAPRGLGYDVMFTAAAMVVLGGIVLALQQRKVEETIPPLT